MYINNCHFALPLHSTHVTDWSIDDAGGSGQCLYPVGKATISTQHHIKKKNK
jgi:hypothetical protein